MSRKRNERTILAYPAVAGADITRNMVLVAGTREDLVVPSSGAAGEKFVGLANMNAKVGQSVGRVTSGEYSPIAKGDIQFGDPVKMAPNGAVTKAQDADHGTGLVIGRASSSAVDGEPVTVEVGQS